MEKWLEKKICINEFARFERFETDPTGSRSPRNGAGGGEDVTLVAC